MNFVVEQHHVETLINIKTIDIRVEPLSQELAATNQRQWKILHPFLEILKLTKIAI